MNPVLPYVSLFLFSLFVKNQSPLPAADDYYKDRKKYMKTSFMKKD